MSSGGDPGDPIPPGNRAPPSSGEVSPGTPQTPGENCSGSVGGGVQTAPPWNSEQGSGVPNLGQQWMMLTPQGQQLAWAQNTPQGSGVFQSGPVPPPPPPIQMQPTQMAPSPSASWIVPGEGQVPNSGTYIWPGGGQVSTQISVPGILQGSGILPGQMNLAPQVQVPIPTPPRSMHAGGGYSQATVSFTTPPTRVISESPFVSQNLSNVPPLPQDQPGTTTESGATAPVVPPRPMQPPMGRTPDTTLSGSAPPFVPREGPASGPQTP